MILNAANINFVAFNRFGYHLVDGRPALDGQMFAVFTIILAGASILPTVAGATGWVYLAGALVLSLWFLAPAYAFYRARTARAARRVLMASILYIPLLVVLIFVDRWV